MHNVDRHSTALFLDVDGTLVDIQATPDDVVVPDDLVDILTALLRAFDGAVAIVTGRPIADIDRMFAPLRLAAAGVHGIQMRLVRNGHIEVIAPKLPEELLREISVQTACLAGITVEPKEEAVAVHYRRAPGSRDAIERLLKSLVRDYDRQLEVSQGRMVFEVLPRAVSKGQALRRLASQPPFRGRKPVMIGDDAPDVSALEIARDLGGTGFEVGGEYFQHASADFKSPADVRAWLRRLTKEYAD